MSELNHKAAEQDYLNGMKYRELAEKYSVSINTIKSWKQRHSWDRKKVHTTENVCTQKKVAPVVDETAVELSATLTEKEQMFCEVYVRNFNATQAAIKAGYSINTAYAIGYENLKKPHIKAYISYLKELKKSSIMIDADDIVERHMRIAFSDITDFVDFGRTTVAVMTAFGPLMMKNPVTGKKEAVMKEINEIRMKESYEVDGGLISQIKSGKDGVSVKLEDRQKSLDWLSNYFDMNPQDKHKRDFESRRLDLQERVVKVQEANKNTGQSTTENDGFMEALQGSTAAIWADDDKDSGEVSTDE